MSDTSFDPNAMADEVLGDAITPEMLAAFKNPDRVEVGNYIMVVTAVKIPTPEELEAKPGLPKCRYLLEIVRPESGAPSSHYPRQSLAYWDTVKEFNEVWAKLVPERTSTVKTMEKGAQDWYKLTREACVGIQFVAKIYDYVPTQGKRAGEIVQSLRILAKHSA